MMKKLSRNAYLRQQKNGHLKLSIRLSLHVRGIRDARKAIIRENENGIYVSPFIYQEIHMYNLAFHIEKEQLINSLMSIQTEVDILQSQIEQKELLSNLPDPETNFFPNGSHLEQASAILRAKKQELLSFKNMQSEIALLHGKQLYNILQAKISAYWNGALQVSSGDTKLPPIIIIDQLAQGGELHYESE